MQIILANPRGFCAGVERAIEIVKRALHAFGPPIYVRHEVVHNRIIVKELEDEGVVFIEDITQVPEQSTIIFSAHGVSPAVVMQAKQRNLRIIDATCPLVTKVHNEVARSSLHGQECILIGHQNHPEVEGTLGHYTNKQAGIYRVETAKDVFNLTVRDPELLSYVTQTTLSLDDTADIIAALQKRFPKIRGPKLNHLATSETQGDICYATQNRQDAIKRLAQQTEIVFVIGSANSSNSNRLKEAAERYGNPAYLIDSAEQIQRSWLDKKTKIGITAGASAPEWLVQDLIAYLKNLPGFENCTVSELEGLLESVKFALPKSLRTSNPEAIHS